MGDRRSGGDVECSRDAANQHAGGHRAEQNPGEDNAEQQAADLNARGGVADQHCAGEAANQRPGVRPLGKCCRTETKNFLKQIR